MKLRSLLYVPASEQRFIRSAHTRGADAIILDLEDAVATQHKAQARGDLTNSIQSVAQSGAKVFVRINADMQTALLDTQAALIGGADGLLVSKASVRKLHAIDNSLGQGERDLSRPPMALIPMAEDPGAVLDARSLAQHPRTIALMVGSEDIALSLGGVPDPDVLRFPKQLVHYAAKAEGRLSLGMFRTVAYYNDLEQIAEAAQEARRHGFDGASCVHPTSVAILNQAFSPSPSEIAWANDVCEAAERLQKGAFELGGKMIDAPVIERAKNILAKTLD